MRSQSDVSCSLLFASALVSLLLGSIASPIIGGEQSWATLTEPEFLAYDAPDAANLPNPSTRDTGADWSSLAGNTAEVPQQENIPYLISDGMVRDTSPLSKGPPTPLHPELQEWDFRRYAGYPSEDSKDLYNPKTHMYWAQKILSCPSAKQIFCCRPDDIKCCTFLTNWPQCIPRQQRCCDGVDKYENGENCSAPMGPAQDVDPKAQQPYEEMTEGSYEPSQR